MRDGSAGGGILAHASREQIHQPGRNNNLIKTQALLHKYVQAGVKYATAGGGRAVSRIFRLIKMPITAGLPSSREAQTATGPGSCQRK